MKHLKSNFSEEEAPLFKEGQFVIGESNELTDLFKFVGKYVDLKTENKINEIAKYNPDDDNIFIHENMGYTEIKRRVNARTDLKHYVSRRYLVNISRKWCLTKVVLSYDTHKIIKELYQYISENDLLRKACVKYISGNKAWDEIMPIQFKFLSARRKDMGKDWDVAKEIINELSVFSFGDKHHEVS